MHLQFMPPHRVNRLAKLPTNDQSRTVLYMLVPAHLGMAHASVADFSIFWLYLAP